MGRRESSTRVNFSDSLGGSLIKVFMTKTIIIEMHLSLRRSAKKRSLRRRFEFLTSLEGAITVCVICVSASFALLGAHELCKTKIT